MLQDIRGTQDVDEEFSDICDACVEANKVRTTYIISVVSQSAQARLNVMVSPAHRCTPLMTLPQKRLDWS